MQNINSKNLYKHYENIINKAKVDIFYSGDVNKEEIESYIKENENIKALQGREIKLIIQDKKDIEDIEVKNIEEKMDITQGKLIIGLDVKSNRTRFKVSNIYI